MSKVTILPADTEISKTSKFFYGETVRHKGDGKLYTVCDLSKADDDVFGLWLLGTSRAIPSYYSYGSSLESISQDATPALLP